MNILDMKEMNEILRKEENAILTRELAEIILSTIESTPELKRRLARIVNVNLEKG